MLLSKCLVNNYNDPVSRVFINTYETILLNQTKDLNFSFDDTRQLLLAEKQNVKNISLLTAEQKEMLAKLEALLSDIVHYSPKTCEIIKDVVSITQIPEDELVSFVDEMAKLDLKFIYDEYSYQIHQDKVDSIVMRYTNFAYSQLSAKGIYLINFDYKSAMNYFYNN